jgi:acyl-CoA synthetase (AMP-forming)/AMP-acid ligase II
VVAALSGITATAAYLDAKFHIRHDLRAGSRSNAAAKAMEFTVQKRTEDRMLVYHYLEDWAKQDIPNHLFLDFEGELWTYKRFYLAVQRVGNWLANDLGIEKGEVVALDGPNSCSYLLLWYALEGIGACPAFINSNLTGESLQHCVKVSRHGIQQVLVGQRES